MMNNTKMSNYDNNTRRFPAAFGGQRGRGSGGRGYAPRPFYPRAQPEKKEEPKIDITSQMNFPSLGGNTAWTAPVPKVHAAAGAGLFSELAAKWQEADDAENARKRAEEERLAREEARRTQFYAGPRLMGMTRSRLYESTSYRENEYDDEYDDDEYEYTPNPAPTLSDAWETVEKKRNTHLVDRGSRWEDEEGNY